MTRSTRVPHFTPRLFDFLRELSRNNDRAWFAANKPRYERDVRDPMLRFIADFAPHLRRISPHFVADPRPVGGSMFRIYRDSRFSRDKSPYKTVASAQFRHARGKDVHAPGFYLHLEPGNVFAAVGLWRPEAEPLRLVREAIVDDPAAWRKAVGGKRFRESYELEGEVLKRPPRGFPPDHPLVEELKRKDFVATTSFETAETFEPDFLDRYVATARAAAPFMAFLTGAVQVPW
jgi:uncharacterized protein (TIGR02453 family)